MQHVKVEKGRTDQSLVVMMRQDADGLPSTGITVTGLTARWWRVEDTPGVVVSSVANALAAVDSSHNDYGMFELTSTEGLYRLDLPDALFIAGTESTGDDNRADRVYLQVTGASDHSDPVLIELVDSYFEQDRSKIDAYSLREIASLLAAHAFGNRSGGGTGTVVFNDIDTGAVIRITMPTDADGNSTSAPTLTPESL